MEGRRWTETRRVHVTRHDVGTSTLMGVNSTVTRSSCGGTFKLQASRHLETLEESAAGRATECSRYITMLLMALDPWGSYMAFYVR